MKKLTGFIIAAALALATPFASAAVTADQGGIDSATTSSAYWYAGTSGVSPN
jgi:Spy/CpxP family protein refolding chaperone